MADTPAPIPTAWRTRPADATRPGRRWLALLLLALVAVSGTFLGVMFWLSPPRSVALAPLWITTEPTASGIPGVVPWTQQDRATLLEDRLLGTPTENSANPSRDQIRLRLKALSARSASEPIVVYLSAPANIDGAGQVYLLGADPIGDHPRNRIALAEVLELVRAAPAEQRLVVLDLWPMANRDVFAPPVGLVSDATLATLVAVPDERRLCLLSCDAGQGPIASPVLGHTLFGHYLAIGLHGAADGWNDTGRRDGRVSVLELAAFARMHVQRWSQSAAIAVQSPRLVGSAADFTVHPATLDEAIGFLEQPTAALGAYPDWLKAAWANVGSSPRRESLLRAEQAWVAGKESAAVQREWEKLTRYEATRATSGPIVSLSALPLASQEGAAKLGEELRAAIVKAEAAPPSPAPGLARELEPFKTRSHDETALAVFTILAKDAAPPTARLRQLDGLLTAQKPTPRFAETLLIRRLAELEADPATTAVMLRIGSDFEEASLVPAVIEQAKPALEEAYRRWRAAQAAVFSPGYVSKELTSDRIASASSAVRQIKTFADSTLAAHAACDEAQRTLRSAYPAFLAGIVGLPAGVRVADASFATSETLDSVGDPLTLDTLATAVDRRQQQSSELRESLLAFRRPFASAALAALRDRASASDATIAMSAEIFAMLNTDLVPSADRPALWETYLALARRFSEEVTRLDREEIRNGTVKEYRNPRDPGMADQAPSTLDRQEQWANLELRARGVKPAASDDRPASQTATSRLDRLRIRGTAGPDSLTEKFTRASPLVPVSKDLWTWQTQRFEYEAHDPLGPGNGSVGVAFAADAARACRSFAGNVATEAYLDFSLASEPVFKAESPSTSMQLGIRLIGSPSPLPVALQPLTFFPQWFAAQIPSTLELPAGREEPAKMALTFTGAPPGNGARGVLLEATVEGRTFHHRFPLSLDVMVNALQLIVTNDPKAAPREAKEILLRPHGEAAPYLFSLSNPGPNPRSLLVRLSTLGVETKPFTLAPRSLETLAFPAPAAPPGLPVAEGPAFRDLSQPLVFEVLEAEGRKLVQKIEVPVTLLDPSRYLTVTDVSYRPAVGGRLNALSVRLRPESPLGPPPCPVEMIFPAAANPALMVRDGKLKGPLPTDGQPLRLYAEGLTVGGAPPSKLFLTLTTDGSERAFTFAGTLPSEGESMRLAPVTEPMVRVRAAEFASGIKPLPVRVEVDNAPEDSRLELKLGTMVEDRFVADATKTIATPRERTTSVALKAPEGVLLLKGVLRDWATTLPVDYLVGVRDLEVSLVDETGKVLAMDRTKVTFDSVPPTNIEFLSLPPRVAKEKPLTVRATSDKPVSGMKEVKFFVGKPVKGEAPPNTPTVAGKLIDPRGNVWEAVLPSPTVEGPITFSALFTSRAGLTGVGSQDAESLPEAEANKPEPATITGKLVEGRLAQGGITVVLLDAKGEKGRVKTKPDGSFQFSDVAPGKYKLHAEKESTNRKADADVDVKAGETKNVALELFL